MIAQLGRAVTDALSQGQAVPCVGRDEWISEDLEERAEAAALCKPCPILAACASAAPSQRRVGSFGVWAGVDRAPGTGKPGRPKTRAS
jgi:hypothetical protein